LSSAGKFNCRRSQDDLPTLKENQAAITDAVKDSRLANPLAALDFISKIPLNTVAQFMHVVKQLALVKFDISGSTPGTPSLKIDISQLSDLDPLENDTQFGVCPFPLYQFTAEEVAVLAGEPNPDDARAILQSRSILQYFFPAADQLALGLIDRGTSADSLVDQLLSAPQLGHPFGSMELVKGNVPLTGVIDALQDRGLVVEGEIGLEVGPEGQCIRTNLKFKPREGIVSKVINRFSLNLDLKDLFKH